MNGSSLYENEGMTRMEGLALKAGGVRVRTVGME